MESGCPAGQVAFCIVTEPVGQRDVLRMRMLAEPAG